MNDVDVPLGIQNRYSESLVCGRRITRLEENPIGDVRLSAQTAWTLGTQSIGIFVGGCDPLFTEKQLSGLRQTKDEPTWVIVASSKNMALHLSQQILGVKVRANSAVPKKPVACDNLILATPETLRLIGNSEGRPIAGIILEDMRCWVHHLRGDTGFGRNRGTNDRPQRIVDFRNSIAQGNWLPPFVLLTERPARTVETDAVARAYCLDAWWFVDGRTFSCGSLPNDTNQLAGQKHSDCDSAAAAPGKETVV
jgi:hypothetical protein